MSLLTSVGVVGLLAVQLAGLCVVPFGHFSGLAGGVALAVIATPIIVRTTEDMLGLVPLDDESTDVVVEAYKDIGIRVVFAPMVCCKKYIRSSNSSCESRPTPIQTRCTPVCAGFRQHRSLIRCRHICASALMKSKICSKHFRCRNVCKSS